MARARYANITKTVVDSLVPGETVRDVAIKGFGVRRQQGAPIFFLQKRIGNRIRWLTIGPHGAPWTAALARKEALRLLSEVATGSDPQEQKQRQRARAPLAKVVPEFMAEHGPKLKPRTREEYARLFKLRIVPALGRLTLEDITTGQVTKFHASLADKPAQANFALAVVSKLMAWAAQTGRCPKGLNPCQGVKKYRARKRERYLSGPELVALGDALRDAETHNTESMFFIAAVRLLLTGARRSEILSLRWREVDFERGALRLPDSKTGEKVIQLGAPALELLANLPRLHGNPFVIPGERDGAHLVNIQKPWNRIREAAGLPDVRLHDLRHSFASVAVASGGSLPMIGKLLGHSQPQTTARYAHLADDPLTQLNNAVSGTIAAAIMSKKEDVA